MGDVWYQDNLEYLSDLLAPYPLPPPFYCIFGVYIFLAHLSQRLMGELIVYQWLRRPSVVRRLSTFSNIFSSETTGPIEFKFYKETP